MDPSVSELVQRAGSFSKEEAQPLPLPEFEKLDPKHFRELHEFPAFMCIRAVKK